MEANEVKRELSDKYSLRGRVYDRIRDDILKGRYKSDEAIKEIQISKELGVSRTPVREALRQLELEELVTIIPNKGAFVNGITPKDIHDIFVIRSLIEGVSAKWAANIASDEDIKQLEELCELADFYGEKKNYAKLHEIDTKFHMLIYELSGSKILKHVLSDFHKYIQRVRKASISSEGRSTLSLHEHEAIVEAIKNREPNKAETLMNKHVKNTAKNVVAHNLQKVSTEMEEKSDQ